MGGPEANLVRRVLAELNSWPDTYAIKTHGSRFGRAGTPDILGSRYGQIFLLELKAPGRKPTVIQRKELARWRASGARADWFDSFDAAVDFVRATPLPCSKTPSGHAPE